MLGSLAAVELPPSTQPPISARAPDADDDATYPLDPLHDVLYDKDRIEVPVIAWPHAPAYAAPRRRLLRVSAQLYNDAADYDRLAAALASRI
jgi:isopenicillin-N epimerase